jgi:DNA replication protein DnaC
MDSLKDSIPSVIGTLGTENQLTLNWTCPTCGPQEPLRLPSGRFLRRSCPCERAARQAQRQAEQHALWLKQQRLRTYSWLGERWSALPLLEKTFANFDASRQVEAYEAAQGFTSLLRGTLILYGSFGTGKTHLLAAICNALLERGSSCRFVTAPKLFAAVQHQISLNEDYSSLLAQAIQTPLLVIDDVDKAKPSEFREELYFEVIDERTKTGRPIALSTNRLGELERFVGGACLSRLSIGQVAIEMSGADYRLEL